MAERAQAIGALLVAGLARHCGQSRWASEEADRLSSIADEYKARRRRAYCVSDGGAAAAPSRCVGRRNTCPG